jgi:flagellar hook assembly protein FlgD
VGDELNPNEFSLSPAYPNPFNPVTHLDLKIPTAERVKVIVVDILGREVAILQNGMMAPGHYKISWDGTNRFGKTVASGTYFAIMKYGEKTKVQKLLFLK